MAQKLDAVRARIVTLPAKPERPSLDGVTCWPTRPFVTRFLA